MRSKSKVQCVQLARAVAQRRIQELWSCISGMDMHGVCSPLREVLHTVEGALPIECQHVGEAPTLLHNIHYVPGICWISRCTRLKYGFTWMKSHFSKDKKDVHSNKGLRTHPPSLTSPLCLC